MIEMHPLYGISNRRRPYVRCNQTATAGQSAAKPNACYLRVPFICLASSTRIQPRMCQSEQEVWWFEGKLEVPEEEVICSECKCKMHRNQKLNTHLRHVPSGAFQRSQRWALSASLSQMPRNQKPAHNVPGSGTWDNGCPVQLHS